MNECLADTFLPTRHSLLPPPTVEFLLTDDLIPQPIFKSSDYQTTGADLFTEKSFFDLTFPLSGVDEYTVHAILHSINNPDNGDGCYSAVDVYSTAAEESEEATDVWDDTLSDMSELTSLSELDREAEASAATDAKTAPILPLHSQDELFPCGYKGCSSHIANTRTAIESHTRQAHPGTFSWKKNHNINERCGRGETTRCRWSGCLQQKRCFFNMPDLCRHIAETHWGSLAHRCGVCGKTYSRRDACIRHVRQKHPERISAI